MAEPRTVGQRRRSPTGSGVRADTGIDPGGFAVEDHQHQLWTPWIDVVGLGFDYIQYSLSPPLIAWDISIPNVLGPLLPNPMASNLPFPPKYRMPFFAGARMLVFEVNGDLNLYETYDLTTAPIAGAVLFHGVYRYDS